MDCLSLTSSRGALPLPGLGKDPGPVSLLQSFLLLSQLGGHLSDFVSFPHSPSVSMHVSVVSLSLSFGLFLSLSASVVPSPCL